MLKINLLPNRRTEAQQSSTDSSRIFAIALAGTLVVLIAGLFLFHSGRAKDVDDARARNNDTENQVRQTRSRVADHQHIKDELAEIHAREEAINHLEAARTGPTSMLVELSHITSPGGHPSADPARLDEAQRNQGSTGYNPTWDPHRLWVTRFAESERNVTIEGEGRTPDDVGEFMRRMMLSQYFDQVQLENSVGAQETTTKIAIQRFKLLARVRY